MEILNKIRTRIQGSNRNKKYKIFLDTMKPNFNDSILDIGYGGGESSPYTNFLEKKYPYPAKITALGIDKPNKFLELYPKVNVVKYDGGIFPFSSERFDIGWSNAVLEHVGNFNSQLLFIKEIKRTCKRAFVTTPNKYFPIEIHTRIPLLHFLPKSFFYRILIILGKKWATGNYMNLLSLMNIQKLLKLAKIKNYKIIRNKFWYFTLTYSIIIYQD